VALTHVEVTMPFPKPYCPALRVEMTFKDMARREANLKVMDFYIIILYN
jgi:hypothetical protein